MKGIVSSVKRKVFGKDGEELIGCENLPSSGFDVNHSINSPDPNATPLRPKHGGSPSNPTLLRKTSSTNHDSGLIQRNTGPATDASDRSQTNSSSRRDRLRSRGNSELRSTPKTEEKDRISGKLKKDPNKVRSSPNIPNKEIDGKKPKKNRKEFENQSASFNGRISNVPFDHSKLLPGLLPGSAPNAEPRIFEQLPLLRDATSSAERELLLRKKIIACGSVVFDLEHHAWAKEKEAKADALNEILDFFVNTKSSINESMIPDILHMIGVNIFRDMPQTQDCFVLQHFQVEDDESRHDPQWAHRSLVYEFFVRFVLASEVEIKVMRQYINQSFVLRLLDLFQTEDSREREYLKSLLHRIYGKVMSLRQFIRRSIQNVFHRFLEGHGRPYGISELLEILGSIINGFAIPLKPEHKVMLETSFIPLHKSWAYNLFQNQLQYCMVQYVIKDLQLAETIILGILRYWPVANTTKELNFISEIEEIVTEMKGDKEIFDRIKIPLFSRLAHCIESSHFQVAERVLFLWHPNCPISPIVEEYRTEIFPILSPSLATNSTKHWNGMVHQLTYQVSKLMTDTDEKLFNRCTTETESRQEDIYKLEMKRAECWQILEQAYQPIQQAYQPIR